MVLTQKKLVASVLKLSQKIPKNKDRLQKYMQLSKETYDHYVKRYFMFRKLQYKIMDNYTLKE